MYVGCCWVAVEILDVNDFACGFRFDDLAISLFGVVLVLFGLFSVLETGADTVFVVLG